MASLDALAKVLPVLLLIGLGAFFRRTDFVRPGTVDDLRRLVLGVTLPAALFLTFLRVTIEARYALVVGGVFAACLVAFGAGLLAVRFAGVRPGVVPGLVAGFEGGMIGYAVYGAVFGQEELYHFAIVDLGQMPFVFFVLATWLTRRASGHAASLRDAGVAFVRTPVVLAIVAGIAGGALGLATSLEASPLGDAALRTLGLLGALTTPLIAIVIGYSTRLRRGSLGAPLGDGGRADDGLGGVRARLQRRRRRRPARPRSPLPGGDHDDGGASPAVRRPALPAGRPEAARRRAAAPGDAPTPGDGPPADTATAERERVAAAEHEFAVNVLSLATVATLVAFVAVSVAYAG